MSLAIECSNLKFVYPFQKGHAPFSLELEAWSLEKGEQCVVYGPSGGGKSTFLNILSGQIPMTNGSLRVMGQQMLGLSERERREIRIQNIGFVFQDFPLLPYLTATENVLLPYRIHPILSLQSDTRQRAIQLLKDLGLGKKVKHFPKTLSQGERQRVAIARALISQPKLVLADEPTAGLDPQRSTQVISLLSALVYKQGMTLLLVTHDTNIRDRFDKQLVIGGIKPS